jgi:hypothetical protein
LGGLKQRLLSFIMQGIQDENVSPGVVWCLLFYLWDLDSMEVLWDCHSPLLMLLSVLVDCFWCCWR